MGLGQAGLQSRGLKKLHSHAPAEAGAPQVHLVLVINVKYRSLLFYIQRTQDDKNIEARNYAKRLDNGGFWSDKKETQADNANNEQKSSSLLNNSSNKLKTLSRVKSYIQVKQDELDKKENELMMLKTKYDIVTKVTAKVGFPEKTPSFSTQPLNFQTQDFKIMFNNPLHTQTLRYPKEKRASQSSSSSLRRKTETFIIKPKLNSQ